MANDYLQIQDKGKYVTVKIDRQCHHCKAVIAQKTRCFTQSIVVRKNKKSKRQRVWTCLKCPIPNKQPLLDLDHIMEKPFLDPFDPYLTPFDTY